MSGMYTNTLKDQVSKMTRLLDAYDGDELVVEARVDEVVRALDTLEEAIANLRARVLSPEENALREIEALSVRVQKTVQVLREHGHARTHAHV